MMVWRKKLIIIIENIYTQGILLRQCITTICMYLSRRRYYMVNSVYTLFMYSSAEPLSTAQHLVYDQRTYYIELAE